MKFLSLILLFSMQSPVAWASNVKCNITLVKKVEQALRGGKQVLLLAWSDKDACGDEDEACGDWADRLNTLKERQGAKVEIFKLPPSQWAQVVTLPVSNVPTQSGLFLFQKHTSYFHSGPILDYDVYQAVLSSWVDEKNFPKNQFLPNKISAELCK